MEKRFDKSRGRLIHKTKKTWKWFDGSPQPHCVVDGNFTTVLAINAAARALFPQIVLPAVVSDVFGSTFATFPGDTGSLPKVEMALGRNIYAVHASKLSNGSFVLAFEDVSSRKELAEQLRQSEKLRSMGMLASGIAHDFNNLLTIISGYAQLLHLSPQLTAERDQSAVEQILKATERAAELTSQLLSFGRKRPLLDTVLETAKVVEQTMSMLRRLIGAQIDLRVESDSATGRIRADIAQIQQLVINLVVNARDVMPDGGILRIETRNETVDQELAAQLSLRPGAYVSITVSDTGPGMDLETRSKAFEPFFTTKEPGQGTGLGLSTVSNIVAHYDGAIDLITETGQGTVIRVFFPRVDAAAAEDKPAGLVAPRGSETILLAEDDRSLAEMIQTCLERSGYRVLCAGNGKEALRLSRAFDERIDLLLADRVMPEMRGEVLAGMVTRERPDVRVLLVSGYAGEADVPFSCLDKPFTPAALAVKVREVLDGGRLTTAVSAAG